MLIHICRRCGFQTKICDDWINHLWEQKHQTVSRSSFLKWSDEDNLKSLVIYAPAPPYPLPSDVLSIFIKQSITVVDFVCWVDRPQNFVIQFNLKEDVERVLKIMRQQPSELAFSGNTMGLRRKSDIADFEWPGLIGDRTAQNGSSETPILIELSDDSHSNSSNDVDMNSTESGNDTTNGGISSTNENGHDVPEEMDTSPAEQNGAAREEEDVASAEADNNEEPFETEIETKISDEYRNIFLEKVKLKPKKAKDDKGKVMEELKLLQSQWLDVYIGFHNRLWPLCFDMKNRSIRTNRNEVGFEAKFVCECVPSKFNEWLSNTVYKREIVDAKIKDFSKFMCNDVVAEERWAEIRGYTKRGDVESILKFKCHIIVTFSVSGDATAKMKLENFKGRNVKRKMKHIQKIFKKLFTQFEISKINEWSVTGDTLKKEVKTEKCEGTSWTQIEVITVE